ncbi:hypothetical protein [Streptomyces lonarensis]|nr:hypothetical protein [Streptomyces lonarensis]
MGAQEMSAGNNGNGRPEGGEDPFGYLYRPQDGQAPPQAPQQPSYHDVRPVGERRGQRTGYGYPQPAPTHQHAQDPYYAAPETQPGGGGYHAAGGPGPYQPGGEPPRRNTLLIGAIAVVAAVVIGVGAALIFSGDDGDSGDQADDGSSEIAPDGGEQGGEEPEEDQTEEEPGDDGAEEGETEEEPPSSAGLPTADLTADLDLRNGATLGGGHVEGARSADGSYIAGLENEQATVSWRFDFDGSPGTYRLYVGYTMNDGDQEMSFAINDTVRSDKVNFRDYRSGGSYQDNWTRTYNEVTLQEGSNLIQIGCGSSDGCDVLIDRIEITENVDGAVDW